MTDYERIEKVLRHLERNYLKQPSLAVLASVAGLSEFHFHRMFSRWAGTTPKEFIKFLTASHAKQLLAESRDLLSTAFESGLSGPGRLHDLLVSVEAVTPGEFKSKGAGVEIRYGIHPIPFGHCLIGVTSRGICHLAFLQENEAAAVAEMKTRWTNATFRKTAAGTAAAAKSAFGDVTSRRVRLVVNGTPFQIKVWEALLRIPAGHVMTYSDIARAVGSPGASRSVGSAIGRNSIAYLIPCHRVIREGGDFGEYRWGATRKQTVLAWEAAKRLP